jgi:hypothetical protein
MSIEDPAAGVMDALTRLEPPRQVRTDVLEGAYFQAFDNRTTPRSSSTPTAPALHATSPGRAFTTRCRTPATTLPRRPQPPSPTPLTPLWK